MGGIFAKLDNQDKIISLEKKTINIVKEENQMDLNKLRDYINKHGYIKIEISLKELETYVRQYVSKYFKKNEKDIVGIVNKLGGPVTIGSMMFSNFGFFVLYEKPVEKFTNFSDYTNDFYDNFETFLNIPPDLPQTKLGAVQGVRPEARPEARPEVIQEVMSGTRPSGVSPVSPSVNAGSKQMESITILLPKIYFTGDRNEFLDFLMTGIPQTASKTEFKQNLLFISAILNKINETPNPEVKIANTIGLLVRISLMFNLMGLVEQYSSEEKVQILSGLINDNLEDIPFDRCVFYNDKMNFIKFTPNFCLKVKEEKENEVKQLVNNLSKAKSELQTVLQAKVSCPIEEKSSCPKCGEPKCDKNPCPTCSEPSKLWKYASVGLLVLLIIVILMMLLRSSNSNSDIRNLTKLK